MEYDEEDWLQLAGIQHYAFCPRQWALIHLEQQWEENYRTVEGDLMHAHVHDVKEHETRGDVMIVRGLPVHSAVLGISGQCDVVEFQRDRAGVPLRGREGLWLPYPVEYKRGQPKKHDADALQLCAQAMCLEEMLCCSVPAGAMYYGEPRRREPLELTAQLREKTRRAFKEMHELFALRRTPSPRRTKSCAACSLHNICLPRMHGRSAVANYVKSFLEGDEEN